MIVLFYGKTLEYTNGVKLFKIETCAGIRELINQLGVFYGERLKEFLSGSETCFFLLNGKGIMMTGGLDTKLQFGDKIEVLPFMDAG